MNEARADLTTVLSALLGAAEATKGEETAVRRAAAARIAELERARVRAYRRHHFIQLLGSVVATAPDRATALAAQTMALSARLAWSEGMTSEQREVIAAMEPLMIRVADASGVPSPSPQAPEAIALDGTSERTDIVPVLETFEQWFATRFESDFFLVFERYTPSSNVTDF